MKPCRVCGTDKLQPSAARRRQYICSACASAKPTAKACRRRYMAKWSKTPAGRRVKARRIIVDGVNFGQARTPEEAAAIKAHARRMIAAFKERKRAS